MADGHTAAAPVFNDPRVDLLVVYDGDNFRKPWPDGDREKHGSLSGWDWKQTSCGEAVYRATKPRDDDDFYASITMPDHPDWVTVGVVRVVVACISFSDTTDHIHA
jgi:hypothetical protein